MSGAVSNVGADWVLFSSTRDATRRSTPPRTNNRSAPAYDKSILSILAILTATAGVLVCRPSSSFVRTCLFSPVWACFWWERNIIARSKKKVCRRPASGLIPFFFFQWMYWKIKYRKEKRKSKRKAERKPSSLLPRMERGPKKLQARNEKKLPEINAVCHPLGTKKMWQGEGKEKGRKKCTE